MALAELLKAKDEAIALKTKTASELATAEEILLTAQQADEQAEVLRVEAHKAIRDVLVDKGDHAIVSPDGTVTIYRAVDITEGCEQGWLCTHPVIGAEESK